MILWSAERTWKGKSKRGRRRSRRRPFVVRVVDGDLREMAHFLGLPQIVCGGEEAAHIFWAFSALSANWRKGPPLHPLCLSHLTEWETFFCIVYLHKANKVLEEAGPCHNVNKNLDTFKNWTSGLPRCCWLPDQWQFSLAASAGLTLPGYIPALSSRPEGCPGQVRGPAATRCPPSPRPAGERSQAAETQPAL